MGTGLAGTTKGCVRLIWGWGGARGSGFRKEGSHRANPAGQGILVPRRADDSPWGAGALYNKHMGELKWASRCVRAHTPVKGGA